MQDQTPCTDYQKTKGLIYFARMLDKIRLNAAGKLAPGYFCGVEDPTFFDARCTRLLGIGYDELVERTLEGGSDEEILEWCFANGRKPNDEEIAIWNSFLAKRGWRDEASSDLAAAKARAGWEDRDDVATMDRILASDFVLVTGLGKTYTKADLLEEARRKRTVYEHQEDSARKVRVWGDTAVVTALLWAKGTEDGKAFDYKLWFSDTYVRTPTGWRYAFAQASTRLPATP